eukprot:TRINITY_DN1174_c0_g1_i1.p1 TRINITY_DN1174_c0_g1~~TRINITY_DN1174_c0_g1_i1.p1  ORF type:complete len:468 (-),score=98.06 TRINITY_DN1174_c0_g1_i1:152-1555(-)
MPPNVVTLEATARSVQKSANAKQFFTSEQVAKHNDASSLWVSIDGKVYDLTTFVNSHPGGADLLLLSAGRDATHLFHVYHTFTDAPEKKLEKFYIGDLSDSATPVYTKKSEFYDTLKKRIRAHFAKTKEHPTAPPSLYARMLVIYTGMIGFWYGSFFLYSELGGGFATNFVMAFLFGVVQSLFSLQLMHDASHAALTRNPFMWKLIGASWDLLTGASFYAWLHQHIVGHHIYTNVRGHDPDIGVSDPDIRRIVKTQKWYTYYFYQHIYAPIIYGLLTFKFRIMDFEVFFLRRNGPIKVSPPTMWHWTAFFAGKLSFLVMRFYIPLFVLNLPLLTVIQMLLVTELLTGYWLTYNFQVSHVTPELTFVNAIGKDTKGKRLEIDQDWAAMQVMTTQDYSHGSWVPTYLSGALNYQVVHHLFPGISQIHYPAIAPIVLKTCKEFGIPYLVKNSFWEALKTHWDHLKVMSSE